MSLLPRRGLAALAALVLAAPIAAPLSAGVSANTRIPAEKSLRIGGDTPKGIDVDGQNRSAFAVEMLVESDGKQRFVRTLAPKERFIQYIRKDETIVFRNTSEGQRATVYWHVSGYSKQANPRVE